MSCFDAHHNPQNDHRIYQYTIIEMGIARPVHYRPFSLYDAEYSVERRYSITDNTENWVSEVLLCIIVIMNDQRLHQDNNCYQTSMQLYDC